MNAQILSRINLWFAILLFVAAGALMILGDNRVIPMALLPIAFANLTIGIVVGRKARD